MSSVAYVISIDHIDPRQCKLRCILHFNFPKRCPDFINSNGSGVMRFMHNATHLSYRASWKACLFVGAFMVLGATVDQTLWYSYCNVYVTTCSFDAVVCLFKHAFVLEFMRLQCFDTHAIDVSAVESAYLLRLQHRMRVLNERIQ